MHRPFRLLGHRWRKSLGISLCRGKKQGFHRRECLRTPICRWSFWHSWISSQGCSSVWRYPGSSCPHVFPSREPKSSCGPWSCHHARWLHIGYIYDPTTSVRLVPIDPRTWARRMSIVYFWICGPCDRYTIWTHLSTLRMATPFFLSILLLELPPSYLFR